MLLELIDYYCLGLKGSFYKKIEKLYWMKELKTSVDWCNLKLHL